MSNAEPCVSQPVCYLHLLPDESLMIILRYLHYSDLVRVSETCSRLWRLSADDVLWKWQCLHYFMEDVCSEGLSWKQLFVNWFRDFGKYPQYKEIKSAWNKVERFCREKCPRMFLSVQAGVTEADLDKVEEVLGVKLPLDLRVSYRIHNGQNMNMSTPGLMGGGIVVTHIRTDRLCPLKSFTDSFRHHGVMVGCIAIAKDEVNNTPQLMALTDQEGFTVGSIYEPERVLDGWLGDNCFIKGSSFSDWFCSYADKLEQDAYYIHPNYEEYIFKFYHEPGCVATTAGITVKPTVCFMPELSRCEQTYFFAYRIILEMAEDAHPDMSCQLEIRHWYIRDENAKDEIVHGPGVVGQFPIMRPGKTFDWISCCTFETPRGSMEGYFSFRNLLTGAVVKVKCPRFHMKALPMITKKDRKGSDPSFIQPVDQRDAERDTTSDTDCDEGTDSDINSD